MPRRLLGAAGRAYWLVSFAGIHLMPTLWVFLGCLSLYPALALGTRSFGALDRLDGHVLGPHVKTVFRIWVLVFGLVGAQMAWVLRPFIGAPGQPFVIFRGKQSNFFEAIWQQLADMLRGGLECRVHGPSRSACVRRQQPRNPPEQFLASQIRGDRAAAGIDQYRLRQRGDAEPSR